MGTAERRLREKNERKKSILEVATKLFKNKGFLNTTMEEIASETELSVGSLYLYYKSKEELYLSLVFEAMDVFTDNLRKIKKKDLSPDRKMKRVWNFFYEFKRNYPIYFNILLFLNNRDFTKWISMDIMRMINKKSGENFRLAEEIVRECMDAGIYKRMNPRMVVDILWSTFIGLVQLTETRVNLGLKIKDSATIFKEAFNLVQNGLRR